MTASVPLAQRFGAADNREIFSSLVNRATGCIVDRTGSLVCLDLIVDGVVHRFEFSSDEDLRGALELVKARRLPLSNHGALVRMLVISIIGGLALLAVFALAIRGA